MSYLDLLTRRLIFIGGKGGVGKSTIAAATAMMAARRGRQTLIVSIYEPRLIAEIFSTPVRPGRLTRLDENLFCLWLEQNAEFDDFIRKAVRVQFFYRKLRSSAVYQYFTAAVPGLRELVVLDRIAQLVEPVGRRAGRAYDLVLVDGAATGHGVSFLEVPRAAIHGFSMGPIKRMAYRLESLLADRARTATVLVTLAEEMPVSETLDLRERLAAGPGLDVAAVVVNNYTPPPLSWGDGAAEVLQLRERLAAGEIAEGLEGHVEALLAAAAFQDSRAALNAHHIDRLERQAGLDLVFVPFVEGDGSARSVTEGVVGELERSVPDAAARPA